MALIIGGNKLGDQDKRTSATLPNQITSGPRKIYIEPTTDCNLSCRTCMRNTWEEPGGTMTMETFYKVLDGLKAFDSIETVAIWGIGEPLTHPNITEIIAAVKALGLKTELITNAMVMKEDLAQKIIDAGLDKMIVSVDSASPNQLSEIRKGATLKGILKNVKKLNQLKALQKKHNPELGIEFTVMKSNVGELKNLRPLALAMEAHYIIVTNVLPYAEEHKDEILYSMSATNLRGPRSKYNPEILLPKIDLHKDIMSDLGKISFEALSLGPNAAINPNYNGVCPFVERGSLAFAWNGDVSPCVPLMHTYSCYILGREKTFKKKSFGNIHQETPKEIWEKAIHKKFRENVLEEGFSPCIECGGCDMTESNEEDCFGNVHPTCGDCLWAKGVIQCP